MPTDVALERRARLERWIKAALRGDELAAANLRNALGLGAEPTLEPAELATLDERLGRYLGEDPLERKIVLRADVLTGGLRALVLVGGRTVGLAHHHASVMSAANIALGLALFRQTPGE